MVDDGCILENFEKSLMLRSITPEIINIPCQTIPVVLADLENITGNI
jgi:hypothetical protein